MLNEGGRELSRVDGPATSRPGSECGQLSIGFGVAALILMPTVIFSIVAIALGVAGVIFGVLALRRTRGGLRRDVRNAWLGTTLSLLSFGALPAAIFLSEL